MKVSGVLLTATALLVGAALIGCGGSGSTLPASPPPPAPDFTLGVSPQSLFLPIGVGSGSLQVSVQAINGFSQAVSVSIAGLPAGVTTNPASPFNVAPGMNQIVLLNAPPGLTPGVSSVSAQGVAGALSHSGTFSLSVAAAVYTYIASGNSTSPPNDIVGYAVDANTGALATVSGSPFSLPNPPIDFVVASESGGAFLYALTETNTGGTSVDTLSSFLVDPATGNLTAVQTITYQPNTHQASLAVHPNGKFLQCCSTDLCTGVSH